MNVVAIIIALVVLAGAGVRYFIEKKQKAVTSLVPAGSVSGETATWKTYRNDEYRFEFKYPETWRISGGGGLLVNNGKEVRDPLMDSLNKDLTDQTRPEGYQDFSDGYVSIGVVDFAKLNNNKDVLNSIMSIDNLVDSKPVGALLDDWCNVSNSTSNLIKNHEVVISVNDLRGSKVICSDYPDPKSFMIRAWFHDKHHNSFNIEVQLKGDTFEKAQNDPNVKVFDQIVSTFKFTK